MDDENMAVAYEEQENKEEEAEKGISIDVDIDHNMEWEVETVPPEETDRDYASYEEDYGQDYYDDQSSVPVARRCNKHLFTWVFSFLLGIYGVDRFIRGQIALGVFKLLTFGGFGIWYLVDVIIAASKSYGGAYTYMEDLLFDDYGNYIY